MTTHGPTPVDLHAAVGAAIRAPSVHNTQPWLFRIGDDFVDVHADPCRQLPVADPDGSALRISCGAAILNLRLSLARQGWATRTVLMPDPSGPRHLARVSLDRPQPATPADLELFAAIPHRHTNRDPFLDTAVPLTVRARLVEAARAEGAWLDLINGPVAQTMIAELIRVSDQILLRNDAYQAELRQWLRSEESDDGVPRRTAGTAPEPQDVIARRDFGGRTRLAGHDYESDPLIAVIGGYGTTRRDDLCAGQALERLLLTATANGLVASLVSQPIEVPQVREQLRLGLRRNGPPRMLVRTGYGVPGFSPPRRPIEDVLLSTELATTSVRL